MRTISVKLPERLIAQLTRQAKARRVTKSCIVRDSLEKEFHQVRSEEEASCFDLACDLAGSIKGLPKDLAVNPRYMDGFGS